MVRPSTMFYHRFSLLMGSSPSFGSSIYDSRPIQACFHCGSSFNCFNLATYTNSLVRSTKSTMSLTLHLFKSIRFQVYFTPLPGFFSPFPHGTSSLSILNTIQPWRVVPPDSIRISRVRTYSGTSRYNLKVVYNTGL